jgi:hypothetical protein
MAYFSNGSEGMVFEDQCAKCKWGQKPCPISAVQIEFNYDQFKDTTGTATRIMDALVKEDGTCTVWETFKEDLTSNYDPNQLKLEF